MRAWKPYTYLLIFTNPETNDRLYYYGAKYGKDADPTTFWRAYFTSSESVRELREWWGDECFSFEIRRTFDDSESCRAWEAGVLRRLRVVERDDWLNLHDSIAIDARGKNNGMHGKKHRAASRAKMSASKQGRVYVNDGAQTKRVRPAEALALFERGWVPGRLFSHSEDSRRIIGAKRVDLRGITNGTENRMVPEKELADYLLQGWRRGANDEFKSRRRGRIAVHMGETTKMVPADEFDSALAAGWSKGRVPEKAARRRRPRVVMVVKSGHRKFIRPETIFEHELDGWVLAAGWQKGRPKAC